MKGDGKKPGTKLIAFEDKEKDIKVSKWKFFEIFVM